MSEQTTDNTADVQNEDAQVKTAAPIDTVQTEAAAAPVETKTEDKSQETKAEADTPDAPAAKPIRRNNPFNLIIAQSAADVSKIAKHYDLSDVRDLTQIEQQGRIPADGIKRGEALDRYLGKVDHTITIAILLEPIWIEALLSHSQMATSVWRSIESKLFGHKTTEQRNFMVVASGVSNGVRQAEEDKKLVSFTCGHKLPVTWRPERTRPEPKKQNDNVKVDNQGKNGGKKVEAKQQSQKGKQNPQHKQAGIHGQLGNPGAPIGPGGKVTTKSTKTSPQVQREGAHHSQKMLREQGRPARGMRNLGNGSPMLADLYLFCKGGFGPVGSVDIVTTKAARIIQHHTGTVNVQDDDIVKQLFATLIAFSQRSHWGGFQLLQDLVNASARGPGEVAYMLSGYITTIPVRDQDGNEIEQPKLSKGIDGMLVNGAHRVDRFAGGQDALEASQQ